MRSIKYKVLLALVAILLLVIPFLGKTQTGFVQPYTYKDNSFPWFLNVGNGALKTTHAAAYLEVGPASGATKGLLIPRGSIGSIANPTAGLVIYDIPSGKLAWYNGSQWLTAITSITDSSGSGGSGGSVITYQSPIILDNGTVKWQGTTTNVPEGINLYFTTARVHAITDPLYVLKDTFNAYKSLADLKYVMVPRFLDSLAALRARLLLATDTASLHNQIVALQNQISTILTQTEAVSSISYRSPLYYNSLTNELYIAFWAAVFNAASIQNMPVKAAQPLNGQALIYNAASGMYEPAYPGSGSGSAAFMVDSIWSENDSGYYSKGGMIYAIGPIGGTGSSLTDSPYLMIDTAQMYLTNEGILVDGQTAHLGDMLHIKGSIGSYTGLNVDSVKVNGVTANKFITTYFNNGVSVSKPYIDLTGSDLWNINSVNDLYHIGGFVGIGTSAPQATVHVNANYNIGTVPGFMLTDSSAPGGYLKIMDGTGYQGIVPSLVAKGISPVGIGMGASERNGLNMGAEPGLDEDSSYAYMMVGHLNSAPLTTAPILVVRNWKDKLLKIMPDGALIVPHLASGLTAPTTSGTTKNVIVDANGKLSFGTASGGSGGTTYTFSNSSIVNTSGNLALSGDATTPGNSKVYGTDASGTKGYQAAQTIDMTGFVNGDYVKYNGTTFVRGSGLASQWTTSGSNIYYNTGNVSIGSTSNDGYLDITGALGSTSANAIKISSAGATGAYLRFANGTTSTTQFLPTVFTKSVGSGTGRYGYKIVSDVGEDGSDDVAIAFDGRSAGAALTAANLFSIANFGTERLALGFNGALKLSAYGAGSRTGTAAYALNVDASGNIIEGAVGGGSGTTINNNAANSIITGSATANTLNAQTGLTFTPATTGYQLSINGPATGSSTSNPFVVLTDADITTSNFSAFGFTTSTLGTIGGTSPSSGGYGGLSLSGFSAATATALPLIFSGYHGSTAPTTGAIIFRGGKWNGATTATTLANSEIIAGFRNWTNADAVQILGNGDIKTLGKIIAVLPTFADEAAAVTGGLTTGTLYKTSTGEVRIKL